MGTSSCMNLSPSEYGIVPRVIQEIFTYIHEKESNKEATFIVTVSFLEIYNEEIMDLLMSAQERMSLEASGDEPYIQEKKRKDGIIEIDVKNCKRMEVRNVKEMMEQLERGTRERSVGATNMNAGSSRSHAIFTIHMQFKEHKHNNHTSSEENGVTSSSSTALDDDNTALVGTSSYALDASQSMMQCKFHFVDLAGSERLKK